MKYALKNNHPAVKAIEEVFALMEKNDIKISIHVNGTFVEHNGKTYRIQSKN